MDLLSQESWENNVFPLQDNRKLGYALYGVEDGYPVYYFTGGYSSRYEGRWFDTAAREQGVRLIVPDRPGFGLSDFQPGRRFLDWPGDIRQLADALGIDRFAVLGLSGGGPHVAAVALTMPDRVQKAAIVSGVAPPEMPARFQGMWLPLRFIFLTARYLPSINRLMLQQMGKFYADPEQMKARMLSAMPAPDRELFAQRPEILDVFSLSATESHRQGIDGDAWEWQLYIQPWGFNLADIPVEIGLWYGDYDTTAPAAMGAYLHAQLPQSRLAVVGDGGHFSTINNHISAILEYLKPASTSAPGY
jgi:pimeloyl-ACP methyl ester carboxylesterase